MFGLQNIGCGRFPGVLEGVGNTGCANLLDSGKGLGIDGTNEGFVLVLLNNILKCRL